MLSLAISSNSSFKRWGFAPSGIYQDDLLCSDCDNKIGQYDKYGYDVLTKEIDEKKLQSFGEVRHGYEIGEINVEAFRLFLISLVWRAGIARDQMFQFIKLGVYEERLKQILQSQNSEFLDCITPVIILFRPPQFPDIMWSPFCSKMNGVNIATFYLPPWKVLLKLDRRPFGYPFNNFALTPGKPAYAIVQDFWSKGEFKLLSDVHKKMRATAGFK